MRAVLQRVTSASVRVDGEVVGAIGPGLLIYVGVAEGDGANEAEWLAKRIAELRLFPESTVEGARSMERSLLESSGAALVISQFTLLADTKKGRRPSFFAAAAHDLAAPLVDAVIAYLRAEGVEVATGRFGAHMQVESVNDGPVTITLDSENR
jgi:D-aminoacyl-tRNA deacylase